MTEKELRAIPAFETLPVELEEEALRLCRPDGPEFTGYVYEAVDISQVRDFLGDRQLLPKGASCDKHGNVRAIFWQVRGR